jgi:hypothetical protein
MLAEEEERGGRAIVRFRGGGLLAPGMTSRTPAPGAKEDLWIGSPKRTAFASISRRMGESVVNTGAGG